MSIKKFRYVQYTDDGCSEWQCLNCYKSIEGRLNIAKWKGCPYCFCKWTGEHKCMPADERHYTLVPEDIRNNEWKKKEASKTFWVIEEKTKYNGNESEWKPYCHYDGKMTAKRILEILKETRKDIEDINSESNFNYSYEYRVRKVLKLPQRVY